eukprot:1589309-Alexandrium_andersonii.AAC.1
MSTPNAQLHRPAQELHRSVPQGQGRIVARAAEVDTAPAEHHGHVPLPVASLAEVADPLRAKTRRIPSHRAVKNRPTVRVHDDSQPPVV